MGQGIQEWTKEIILKGCLPPILLGTFLNTLAHVETSQWTGTSMMVKLSYTGLTYFMTMLHFYTC